METIDIIVETPAEALKNLIMIPKWGFLGSKNAA
jgi:hypothetical protein